MRIIGHRGARGEAPENTLGGFQHLKNLGIRAVEFDVRQLQDRALIIMHDDDMQRTTGQPKSIHDCNSNDLCKFNQAQTFQAWTDIEITPLLSQVLKLIHDFEHIEVEVKSVDSFERAEQLVLELEKQLDGFQHNAVITSFDLKIHQALQQQKSRFKRGLLIENDIKFKAIEQAKKFDCCQIGWMDQLATIEMIQACQTVNLNVSVWTVNQIERAKQLQDFGIQGLITDYPTRMLEQL